MDDRSDGTHRYPANIFREHVRLERPQVLVEDGVPTHVFFGAVAPRWQDIYNLVIPLRQSV
jgi:hypothetical protein